MTRTRAVWFGFICVLAGCEDQSPLDERLAAARAEVRRLEKELPGGQVPEVLLMPWLNAPQLRVEKLLQAPNGAAADLEQLKGKMVVIEFWATWCGPCRKAVPHWNELVESCKDDPIVFISITNEDEAAARRWLHDNPISGWIGLDKPSQSGGFGQTAQAYGVFGIPHTVVIDQHGILVAHTLPQLLTREGLLHLNGR